MALLLIGIAFGILSFWLVAERGFNVLVMVPSIAAAITGAIHLTKRQAFRD